MRPAFRIAALALALAALAGAAHAQLKKSDTVVKADPAVRSVTSTGGLAPATDCDQNLAPGCTPLTVDENHYAVELQAYKSVPDFLWETEAVYGWINAAGKLGVF